MNTPGLTDKLYWRQVMEGGRYHCFTRRRREGGYESLCGVCVIKRCGGQQCSRPIALKRCGACDAGEMKRRGKEESLPESEGP